MLCTCQHCVLELDVDRGAVYAQALADFFFSFKHINTIAEG